MDCFGGRVLMIRTDGGIQLREDIFFQRRNARGVDARIRAKTNNAPWQRRLEGSASKEVSLLLSFFLED